MAKYQRSIQKTVLEVMEEAKKNGLPYLTKQQVITEVRHIIKLKKPSTQIGQALWHLSRYSKLRTPKVRYLGKGAWMICDTIDYSDRAFMELKYFARNISENIGKGIER